MKSFHCRCGQAVFFDSTGCIRCGAVLGFDSDSLDIVSLQPDKAGAFTDDAGRRRLSCANGSQFDVCNWLVPESSNAELCWACQFNRTIPDQNRPQNAIRWRRFEIAKKRLLFSLRQLRLPISNGFVDPENGLLFDFIEDRRSNPEQYPESFVQTGFHGGVITINTLEADDAARESIRTEMNEPYRTLLGHLRHESGHYFSPALDEDEGIRLRFQQLFGDSNADYQQALSNYYASGPEFGWQDRYISAYASAHPGEDWAETWAHYLYIYDALETAATHSFIDRPPEDMDLDEKLGIWRELSVALNELNRSSGLADAYPFVVNAVVAEKLRYVDDVVAAITAGSPAPADC